MLEWIGGRFDPEASMGESAEGDEEGAAGLEEHCGVVRVRLLLNKEGNHVPNQKGTGQIRRG